MEDYNGTHEFALFGKDYENFRQYLYADYFLYVRGKVQPHPFRQGELELKLLSMVQFSELRDSVLKELVVLVPADFITEESIQSFAEVVDASAGKMQLRVKLYDPQLKVGVNLFSRCKRVALSRELVGFLESRGLRYTIS